MGACDPVAEADELVLDDLVEVEACRRTNVEETVDGSAVNALFFRQLLQHETFLRALVLTCR